VASIPLSERYRIDAKVARGGMGTVYRAFDEVLGRVVAVKELAGELAEDPEFLERFRREARNAAALLHPNIAGVFDYGQDEGRWFIVMEYVDGEDLASRLDREVRLPWTEVFAIGEQVAAALAHAHVRGVVHRDIKPGNIVLTRDGVAKVTDFGIALAAQATTNLTQTGSVVGTPNYLAPEQARGERVGPGADLYSLGVVLFEALTGTRPFTGESPLALAMAHVTAPVPDPRSRGVVMPEPVAATVVRALAKQPGGRFASAEAMREALAACRGMAAEPAPGAPTTMPPQPHPVSPPYGTVTGGWGQAPSASNGGPPTAGWDANGGWAPPSAPPAHQGWGPPRQPPRQPPEQPRREPGRPGPDEAKARRRRRRTGILAGAGVALAVAGLLGGYLIGRTDEDRRTTQTTTATAVTRRASDGTTIEVQVPFGLVGADYNEARTRLGGLGFSVDTEFKFSSTVDKDKVTDVFPSEGQFTRQGGSISMTVSAGRGQEVRVPVGLVGSKFADARKKLFDAGFAVTSSTSSFCDASQPKGTVARVSPAEGSYVQRGSEISVTVCGVSG
jgi:serine/threonine-protein kinase